MVHWAHVLLSHKNVVWFRNCTIKYKYLMLNLPSRFQIHLTNKKTQNRQSISVFIFSKINSPPPWKIVSIFGYRCIFQCGKGKMRKVSPKAKLAQCEDVHNAEELRIFIPVQYHVFYNFCIHFKCRRAKKSFWV
jgi:hypothetical protein